MATRRAAVMDVFLLPVSTLGGRWQHLRRSWLGALVSTGLCLLLGAMVGRLSIASPELLVLAVICAGGLLLGQRPALVLALFVVIDESYAGTWYFSQIGPLVTTGHQLYQPVKGIPPSLLIVSLALAMLLYSGRGIASVKLRTHGLDAAGITLVGLILWSAALSLAQEKMDFSPGTMMMIAVNTLTAILPWLMALIAYAIAIRMFREPGGKAAFARVLAGALILKGVLGLAVLMTTQGAIIDGQANIVYYDAALPMVAGMAIIGFLLGSDRGVRRRNLLLFLAATIVVFSFRRAVWSAVAVATVLLPLVRQRTVVIKRVAVAALVIMLTMLVLPSSIRDSTFKRVGSAVSVAQGTGEEESAQHHKNDVERGYRIAQEHVWLGVGMRSPQRPEFAFQDTKALYVHNDFLQIWLLLGLPGLVMFVMLFAALCWRGVRTLTRGGRVSTLDAGCAAFAIVCVVPMMTAPFVSTAARWPVLIGVVAAVLRTNATDASDRAHGGRSRRARPGSSAQIGEQQADRFGEVIGSEIRQVARGHPTGR